MSNYPVQYHDRGMGFDPATVAAAITASNQLIKAFGGNAKEASRLAANVAAYKLAAAGRQDAMEYLKYRSGRYGTAQRIGPAWEGGGPVGGWATQTARDDAWRLYQSALSVYGIGVDPMTGGQTPPAGYHPNPTDAGAPDDASLPGGPMTTLPGQTVTGRMDYLPLLLAGAALAYVVTKRR